MRERKGKWQLTFWGRVNTSYTPTKSPLNHLSSICFSSKFYIWMANAEHLFNGHVKFIRAHRGFFSLTDLRCHSESKYIAVFFCYCFLYYWYYYFFEESAFARVTSFLFNLNKTKYRSWKRQTLLGEDFTYFTFETSSKQRRR